MIPDPPQGAPNPIVVAMTNMLKAFHSAVESWGPEYKLYADKIQKWTPTNLTAGYKVVANPMKCGFLVLNHGDMIVNNFMIKYDEQNNPIDLLLVDFQMCFWGSPSCDLYHFLVTSVQDDIKVEHFDDLVEFYHSNLVNGLKKLKYKKHIPTLEELNADLLEKIKYAASTLMITLFPVKLKIALHKAGANGGRPGSPTPLIVEPPLAKINTSMGGISLMRKIGLLL